MATTKNIMWERKETRHREVCQLCKLEILKDELRLICRVRSRMSSATLGVCLGCLRKKVHNLERGRE